MDLNSYDLSTLGSHAHGHYKAAEKAAGKAEEHYKSAGIYLKSAKLRVLKTKGLTWERWLKDHCPISRRRADEVIAISDGRVDLGEAREADAQRKREERAKATTRRDVPPDRPEKPNDFNDGPSQPSASEQSSPKPEPKPEPESDPVKEAEDINAKAHAHRIRVLKSRIAQATEDQLQQIEGILNV